jgi:hypothetical protein
MKQVAAELVQEPEAAAVQLAVEPPRRRVAAAVQPVRGLQLTAATAQRLTAELPALKRRLPSPVLLQTAAQLAVLKRARKREHRRLPLVAAVVTREQVDRPPLDAVVFRALAARAAHSSPASVEQVVHRSPGSVERVAHSSPGSVERVAHSSPGSVERVVHSSLAWVERVAHSSRASVVVPASPVAVDPAAKATPDPLQVKVDLQRVQVVQAQAVGKDSLALAVGKGSPARAVAPASPVVPASPWTQAVTMTT